MDFRFPKEQRIFHKKDIDSLMESGEAIFKYPLKAVCLHREGVEVSRALFSVPKRNFKRAVKRNLLKRRMREAFRLNRHMMGGRTFDIMFVYVGKEVYSYDRIESRMQEIFRTVSPEAQGDCGVSADPVG